VSKSSDGAPAHRPENDPDLEVGKSVHVTRLKTGDDGERETDRGIVRDIQRHELQTRVIVETREREINVAERQVEVLTGADADLVRELVGGGQSDV